MITSSIKIKFLPQKLILFFFLMLFTPFCYAEYYLVYSTPCSTYYKDAPFSTHQSKYVHFSHYPSYYPPCTSRKCKAHLNAHSTRYKVYTTRYIGSDVDNPYYDYADGSTGDDDPSIYPDMNITNPPY